MTRAEQIKVKINELRVRGEIVDKIHIIANGTGYGYETIFGKYLNDSVKEVSLEEPYLREYYQVNYIFRSFFGVSFQLIEPFFIYLASKFGSILWISCIEMSELEIYKCGNSGHTTKSAQWSKGSISSTQQWPKETEHNDAVRVLGTTARSSSYVSIFASYFDHIFTFFY